MQIQGECHEKTEGENKVMPQMQVCGLSERG